MDIFDKSEPVVVAAAPAAAPSTESATPPPAAAAPPAATSAPAAAAPAASATVVPVAGASAAPEFVSRQEYDAVQGKWVTAEPWMPIVQALQKDFSNPDEFFERIKANERQAEQQRQQQAVDRQRYQLARDLQTQVEAGTLDPEVAEYRFQAAVATAAAEHERGQYTNLMLNLTLADLGKPEKYPLMDAQFVRDQAMRGVEPEKAAKASHDRAVQLKQQAIAEYNAAKEADAAKAGLLPEGAGGGLAQARPLGLPDPGKDPAGFRRRMDVLANETQMARYGRTG